jgi:hypothetical protein
MRLHVLAIFLGFALASSPVLVEGGGSRSSYSSTLMHVGELAMGLVEPTFVLAPSDCSSPELLSPRGEHGHNVLILFPTDTPPGPSTTLYVGRVVFTVDTSSNFNLLQHDGQATDICATLS